MAHLFCGGSGTAACMPIRKLNVKAELACRGINTDFLPWPAFTPLKVLKEANRHLRYGRSACLMTFAAGRPWVPQAHVRLDLRPARRDGLPARSSGELQAASFPGGVA